jgi:hypothetical protein
VEVVVNGISTLVQQEILARAVNLEKDECFYRDLAAAMGETCAGAAALLVAMAREEDAHRHRLLDLYRDSFGDEIPVNPDRIRSASTAPMDRCRASEDTGTSVRSGKARNPSVMGRALSIFSRRS